MVLYEELETGYAIKNSFLEEKMATLSERDRNRVYDVVEAMVQFELSNRVVRTDVPEKHQKEEP